MGNFSTICWFGVLLVLAGCGDDTSSGNTSSAVEPTAIEQADASPPLEPATDMIAQQETELAGPPILQPGSWDMRGETLEYELTGVDSDVAAQKKKYLIGRPIGLSQVLTETMAVKPSGSFLAAIVVRGCTDDIRMSSGKIDGTMSCPAEGGGFSKSTLKGTYMPDTYTVMVETTGPVVFRGSSPGATEYRKTKISGRNLDALAKSQGY